MRRRRRRREGGREGGREGVGKVRGGLSLIVHMLINVFFMWIMSLSVFSLSLPLSPSVFLVSVFFSGVCLSQS